MVHATHCHCRSDALVVSIYTQDEGVWMEIHLRGESIGQAQRRIKYDSISTLIYP